MRVVGLDLSLTATGIARVAAGNNHITVDLQRIGTKPTDVSLAARTGRLFPLSQQITALAAGADLAVVEGPTYMSDTGHAHDRSGLWWLVVSQLIRRGIPVAEVAPTTVKVYALGKGGGKGAGKDEVLAAVIHRYLHLVKVPGNNEADALILAAMGARHLGCPIEESLPTTHTRALAAVKWPNTQPEGK